MSAEGNTSDATASYWEIPTPLEGISNRGKTPPRPGLASICCDPQNEVVSTQSHRDLTNKERKDNSCSINFFSNPTSILCLLSFSAQGFRGWATRCSVKVLSKSSSLLQLSYLQQHYSRDPFHLQYRAVQFIHSPLS